VLIVAQRVSTIMRADRIIVLDEGRVVGMGTDQELLASCDPYRERLVLAESEERLGHQGSSVNRTAAGNIVCRLFAVTESPLMMAEGIAKRGRRGDNEASVEELAGRTRRPGLMAVAKG